MASVDAARPGSISRKADVAGERWMSAPVCPPEAHAVTSTCRERCVVVCGFRGPRHMSRLTRSFEVQAAWPAVIMSKEVFAEPMRVA